LERSVISGPFFECQQRTNMKTVIFSRSSKVV
jgi:hypothetical protein